ncbi:MAG: signal peptide peptidase SppA [Alphaproteobacteria bacterium]
MAMSPEAIADRRRMTRRLVVWRTVAALAAALAIVAWAGLAGLGDLAGASGDRVAVLEVSGVIGSDRDRADALERVKDDDAIKALVLRIDSPGGTFVGSDDLHRRIRAVAAEKPVVAVINDVAASGGYMAAIAADRIFARRGSITASVGVIFQTPRVSRLLDSVGVDMDVWRSGELKALPSPLEPPPAAAAAQAQAMVDRLFGMFLDMVRERRGLDDAAAAKVADGRVVTGAEALDLGLIDALGDEAAARDWLAEARNVAADLPVEDVTPPPPLERKGMLGQALAYVLGDPAPGAELALSGLLALWSPLAPAGDLR